MNAYISTTNLMRRFLFMIGAIAFSFVFQVAANADPVKANPAVEKTNSGKAMGASSRGGDYRLAPSLSKAQPAGVEIAPMGLRAEPYALPADGGKTTVRFSVRLAGKSQHPSTVYLRRTGDRKGIAMNDQGKDGDPVAKDGILGARVQVDTSKVKPDSCLSYEAFTRNGRAELVSPPLRLCVSRFPVRIAESNTTRPITFPDGIKAVPDEILVRFAPNTKPANIRNALADINASVVGSLIPENLYQARLAGPVSTERMTALISKLKTHPEVVKAYPNALGAPASTPGDPEFSNQHGLQRIRANDVWDIGATGNGVIIAVLDTGIDRSHPDFGTVGDCQLIDNDCGSATTDFDTVEGHGTAVAGVIAAKTNNIPPLGVAGVAPASKIKSIRVGTDTIYTLAEIRQSFLDAVSYGSASVINASLSIGPLLPVDLPLPTLDVGDLCASINSAILNGGPTPAAIVVGAAGNNGSNGNYYPGRCNDSTNVLHDQLTVANKKFFITVANSISSTTIDPKCVNATVLDQRCGGTTTNINYTSNYGAWVDIAAPGMSIRTTRASAIGGGYIDYTGTSFSAPMVSGAVAILKSCGVPLDQIETTLKTSGANVMVAFPDGTSAPRLDIYRALMQRNTVPTGVGLSSTSINEDVNTTIASAHEIGVLTATDPDVCDKFTYSIVGTPGPFSIGGVNNDRLILTDLLDYESPKKSYAVTVRVTDFFGAPFDHAFTIAVINLNDNPPIITSNGGGATAAISMPENTTAVTTVTATDADLLGPLSYSITGGADAARFAIDSATGALSFVAAPDFEIPTDVGANNIYDVIVQASDGTFTVTQAIAVTVSNVNDNPPIITSNGGGATAAISMPENTTAVTTVTATDADLLGPLSYSITGGVDAGKFAIDSASGVLSFVAAPDFEIPTDVGANNIYDVIVQASDGTFTDTQAIAITVSNVNDNSPIITSNGGGATAAVGIPENTTAVTTVTATDADLLGPLSYSITGGADAARFTIDSATGALSFVAAPDFEIPTDVGANNIYDVIVQASDGTFTGTQAIAVTVTDVIEPPSGKPVIEPPDALGNRLVGTVLSVNTTMPALTPPVTNPEHWSIQSYNWLVGSTTIGSNSTYTVDSTYVGQHAKVCLTYTRGGAVPTVELCSDTDATALGDPHLTTVDGLHYDFQSAGEFVALRDASGMELQVRQTPVSTASAITDGYSGLTSGVSINTAVAARVGNHRVTYQQNLGSNPAASGFELRVDGVLTNLPANGIDLGSGGRVVSSGSGIQIDFPDGSTMIAMPGWWSPHSVWYLNVNIFHTSAYAGIMGARANGSWLPRLSNGTALGAMPAALHDRYVELYEKFADSWRVTDKSSLFDYAPDTSTKTFTFKEWPRENPPYVIGDGPVAKPVVRKVSQQLCRGVIGKDRKADCVFDVMVTGHAGFAKAHLLTQKILIGSTAISVSAYKENSKPRDSVTYTATVSRNSSIPLKEFGVKAVPAGTVQFTLDGERVAAPIKLDANGQARWTVSRLKVVNHRIGARFIPAQDSLFLASSSIDRSAPVKTEKR